MASTESKILVKDWLELYPEPLATASRLSAAEVLKLLSAGKSATILDLRNDRTPGFIRNSVHVPATSIFGNTNIKGQVVDKMYEFNPSLNYIIVHCNSSKNRATKVAGWIQDYINDQKPENLKVAVLNEGITGWLEKPEPYASFVEKCL
ncbi:uncharacterized protein AC631_05176 [Debaryomyces fabryi]|uniref:Rhodanese domain-containing protein n=1 Tax=Debaryomyces fabryi TaxID=58627 RepID=A0A0V1PSE6_9ASCO|nr:uncharacterized protein AC631_05176 [Debaryomyces fabryi]KRZ99074.1 hypothetical protein AC631_05176 [Debaryomyces fabryi]CUM47605.1 unnamed protein product [Debaryomyces fabryi]